MRKTFNYVSDFIEKIGKQNFILIVFILVMLVITGLYQTFSLYTSSEGMSILEGIKTFKFILNNDNVENSVTIAAGSSKNIAITVSNHDKIRLKYAIYYSSNNDLTNVKVYYKSDTDYPAQGLIESNQDYIVTVGIDNNSSNNITIIFGILYGLESGGNLILGDNQYFLETEPFPLSEVEVGSYVAYTGTNGCPEGHCDGTNANYVSDTNMGWCVANADKFTVNGWRVGYIQNDTAYLVSAGATECMCTNTDGTTSSGSCSDYERTNGVPLHLANLDNKALTYCNPTYAYGGTCDSNSTWAMDATDFQTITGSVLSTSNCFDTVDDVACGYGNDLIDNGGYYWYATAFNSTSARAFSWYPDTHNIYYGISSNVVGVRPVLRLASSVQVVGGSGTYEDPYRIENPVDTVQYLSDVEPGSYVAYTGANGCPDGHCDGTNANYVSDTDMGYCSSSDYKFSVNGWRIGYIQNDTAYLVSAGAPECLATYIDSRSSSTSTQTLSTDYYYGSGYLFDDTTGNFSLTGVTSSTLAWSSNYESIIANTPYTCKKTSSTATCTTLYEVTAYSSSTEGVTYPHYNYERTGGVPQHLANLDSKALTYCNPSYAFGGACDSNSAWAMDAIDFEAITGTPLYYNSSSDNSCFNVGLSTECGYGNDLIDNGGYYWYATAYTSTSTFTFSWYPNSHCVYHYFSYYVDGVRPVLRLSSSVQVVGGSGTYADPYQISNS